MHQRLYISNEIFEKEQQLIFKKLWVFAGFKFSLNKDNDYFTRKISGISIVFQNFSGKIKAFENSCLHRNSSIQIEEFGNRKLICPYHGWKYDSEGCVQNIPKCKEYYGFEKNTIKNLRLKEFNIKILGNYIFINLSSDPIDFDEQFSKELQESLMEHSNLIDHCFVRTKWKCNFNWKLVFENLRDFNHINYVHSKSFANYVDFIIDTKKPKEFDKEISSHLKIKDFSTFGDDSSIKKMRSAPWHSKSERFRNNDSYYNWLVYPNLHIASPNGGHSFIIELYTPLSPSETEIEVFWVMGKSKEKASIQNRDQILLHHMRACRRILDEDISILEKTQETLHNESTKQNLGIYEIKNKKINSWYLNLIEKNG